LWEGGVRYPWVKARDDGVVDVVVTTNSFAAIKAAVLMDKITVDAQCPGTWCRADPFVYV
jgi:SH3-like domain-containing protein